MQFFSQFLLVLTILETLISLSLLLLHPVFSQAPVPLYSSVSTTDKINQLSEKNLLSSIWEWWGKGGVADFVKQSRLALESSWCFLLAIIPQHFYECSWGKWLTVSLFFNHSYSTESTSSWYRPHSNTAFQPSVSGQFSTAMKSRGFLRFCLCVKGSFVLISVPLIVFLQCTPLRNIMLAFVNTMVGFTK